MAADARPVTSLRKHALNLEWRSEKRKKISENKKYNFVSK
jgi:hypothetical protein